eukprot:CAMPEP_0197317536 /NCGR_PEP_ID=MMETSP0891-20130614/47467_1 /TAXON_ID=44058 ORGANISM="Aureoumbra lagunensis, Strain CCMP1510" /NCGR_SAMPLE_ID=MMETSP0891 /ASSEMBLY_ACC=CAM_ASM_000534 /LENGTH=1452 /DNA_ID=CAMNT_0042807575 /DNA_START=118 /DNA_END=4476 /DNA_ORIENTATION=+
MRRRSNQGVLASKNGLLSEKDGSSSFLPRRLPGGENKRKKNDTDRVGASLPPRVDGVLKGEVEVSVADCRGRGSALLRLRWWGESRRSVGVAFRVERGVGNYLSKCLFPVRVDERGLATYFRDCRFLNFDVIDPDSGDAIGLLRVPVNAAFRSTLVDARFSAVSNENKRHLFSLRVRLIARFGADAKLVQTLSSPVHQPSIEEEKKREDDKGSLIKFPLKRNIKSKLIVEKTKIIAQEKEPKDETIRGNTSFLYPQTMIQEKEKNPWDKEEQCHSPQQGIHQVVEEDEEEIQFDDLQQQEDNEDELNTLLHQGEVLRDELEEERVEFQKLDFTHLDGETLAQIQRKAAELAEHCNDEDEVEMVIHAEDDIVEQILEETSHFEVVEQHSQGNNHVDFQLFLALCVHAVTPSGFADRIQHRWSIPCTKEHNREKCVAFALKDQTSFAHEARIALSTKSRAEFCRSANTSIQIIEIWNGSVLLGLARVPLQALAFRDLAPFVTDVTDVKTSLCVGKVIGALALGRSEHLDRLPEMTHKARLERMQATVRGFLRRRKKFVSPYQQNDTTVDNNEDAFEEPIQQNKEKQEAHFNSPPRRLSPERQVSPEGRRGNMYRHVLELSMSGTCRHLSSHGCVVKYQLEGERKLWWDGDSAAFNSRARHVIESTSGAPRRWFKSAIQFTALENDAQLLAIGELRPKDIERLASKQGRVKIPLNPDMELALLYRRTLVVGDTDSPLREGHSSPNQSRRTKSSHIKKKKEKRLILDLDPLSDQENETKNTIISLQEPRKLLRIRIEEIRGLCTALRSWRRAVAVREVSFNAELSVRLECETNVYEFRSKGFELRDFESQVAIEFEQLIELKSEPKKLILSVNLLAARSGAQLASIDGPLGLPFASGNLIHLQDSRCWLPLRTGAIPQTPPDSDDEPISDEDVSSPAYALLALSFEQYQDTLRKTSSFEHTKEESTALIVSVLSAQELRPPQSGRWLWCVEWTLVIDGKLLFEGATGFRFGEREVEWIDSEREIRFDTDDLEGAALHIRCVCARDSAGHGACVLGSLVLELSLLTQPGACLDGHYRLVDDLCRHVGTIQLAVRMRGSRPKFTVTSPVSSPSRKEPILDPQKTVQDLIIPQFNDSVSSPQSKHEDSEWRLLEMERTSDLERREVELEAKSDLGLRDLQELVSTLDGLNARLQTSHLGLTHLGGQLAPQPQQLLLEQNDDKKPHEEVVVIPFKTEEKRDEQHVETPPSATAQIVLREQLARVEEYRDSLEAERAVQAAFAAEAARNLALERAELHAALSEAREAAERHKTLADAEAAAVAARDAATLLQKLEEERIVQAHREAAQAQRAASTAAAKEAAARAQHLRVRSDLAFAAAAAASRIGNLMVSPHLKHAFDTPSTATTVSLPSKACIPQEEPPILRKHPRMLAPDIAFAAAETARIARIMRGALDAGVNNTLL